MSWKAKTSTPASFDTPPAGSHPAVLIGLIDLGTQESSFQGKTEWKRQVMLVWELTAEKIEGKDANHVIANRYTFSLNSKAKLRQVLESWRGKKYGDGEEIDVSSVLGKSCLLSVTHTSSGDFVYANVDGVQQVPKGLKVPSPQHKPVARLADDDSPIPDWLPMIYGKSVADVLASRQEVTGKGVEHSSNGTSNGAPAKPAEAGVGAEAEGDEIPF